MQAILSKSKLVILAVFSLVFLTASPSFIDLISGSSINTANSVWNSISNDFMLDHKAESSSRVQAEIQKLLADQVKLRQILAAAGPYIYFIHNEVKARGLPAELALIPVIESEFNPNDRSHKGATGLWQLMPQTAVELGVKVKSGYDGRRNVVSSTKAALAYFNDLGNLFNGDWYLAIAAYNCGQVKVAHVERRIGSNNFWNLPLPTETKLYVPKLLAIAEIIKHHEKYGVELPPITNKPVFMQFKFKTPVSLAQVAKSTGISIQTLNSLNPDYYNHQGKAAKANGANTLLVPVEKANIVRVVFAQKILA